MSTDGAAGTISGAAGPRSGNRSFVDDIFRFSSPLGADYSGSWTDAQIFVIALVEVNHLHNVLGVDLGVIVLGLHAAVF